MRLLAIQKQWQAQVLSGCSAKQSSTTGTKKYVLAQFPYPSGSLHMGHARVYTMADTLARFHRLQGHDVKCPMGWDAFGLPAENAARERKVDPAVWTDDNIKSMRAQMDNLGFAFDLDQSDPLNTSRVEYYKWTRWLFERLYAKGLAYKQEAPVKWDPVDQTVLADEQVDAQGRSWRSGAVVQTRLLSQWFFRITRYADRLVDDLDLLDEWPESVKQMQREWIGRQVGYTDRLFGHNGCSEEVFLTRPFEGIKSITVPKGHSFAHLDHVKSQLSVNINIPVQVSETADTVQVNYHQIPTTLDPSVYKVEKRYRLRDWLISRQRLWGCPIPINNCPRHGHTLSSDPQCEACPDKLPETDTMDTFVDSSWYFLRFCDPKNAEKIFDSELVKRWMPVDVYIGGVEHAVLHLLYARFMHKFVVDEMQLDTGPEPFKRLLCQGLVMGKTFKCPSTGRYLKPGEYQAVSTSGTTVAVMSDGRPARIAYEKMSKSKHNGVDPDSLVQLYGADAVRLNILFKAPPEYTLFWDERDLIGQQRWLIRLLNLYEEYARQEVITDNVVTVADQQLLMALNDTLDLVTEDLRNTQFNTVIAALMKLSNRLNDFKEKQRSTAYKTCLQHIAVMLYPMAPHTASHLHHILNPSVCITSVEWPRKVDLPEGCRPSSTIAVQVDGKTVSKVQCVRDCEQEQVHEQVCAHMVQVPCSPSRIIFIPNRVINYCT